MIACSCVLLQLILLYKVSQIIPKNGTQIAIARVHLLFFTLFSKFVVIYFTADVRKPENSKFLSNYFPLSKQCASLQNLCFSAEMNLNSFLFLYASPTRGKRP